MGHDEDAQLEEFLRIARAARASDDGRRCMVAPHPTLHQRIVTAVRREGAPAQDAAQLLSLRRPQRPGFNDAVIYPSDETTRGRRVAARTRVGRVQRAALHGNLNVVVVLVEFDDAKFDPAHDRTHFERLFFSTGRQIATGSVREYYEEVTNNQVHIQGNVVGPYKLPNTLAAYANNASGTGDVSPNAQTMALAAAMAADGAVNFGLYDNDHDQYVDAFVVVHAGRGAEVTGLTTDIWSHKWVLPNGPFSADGTNLFAYLTVPEDARIGVCAHELGHLLFGLPDLYDTDYTSFGIGDWCLMSGGSWLGNGDRPAHPCAWVKANQEWVTVETVASTATVQIDDVKDSRRVFRLWKDGAGGSEYFLVENRGKKDFDASLPGAGLLVWHVDESVASNSDEGHPKVALVQADGSDHLAGGINGGDGGDPFPGSQNKTSFVAPASNSYGGNATCVTITEIARSGLSITARFAVSCTTTTTGGSGGGGGSYPPWWCYWYPWLCWSGSPWATPGGVQPTGPVSWPAPVAHGCPGAAPCGCARSAPVPFGMAPPSGPWAPPPFAPSGLPSFPPFGPPPFLPSPEEVAEWMKRAGRAPSSPLGPEELARKLDRTVEAVTAFERQFAERMNAITSALNENVRAMRELTRPHGPPAPPHGSTPGPQITPPKPEEKT